MKIARLTALSVEENDMVKRRELHDFSMSDLRMFSSSDIVTLNGYVDVGLFGEVIIYMCSLWFIHAYGYMYRAENWSIVWIITVSNIEDDGSIIIAVSKIID